MKAVACYIRVSTFGPSQATQRREINRWLKAERISTKKVRWYIDKLTEDDRDRSSFEKLQVDIADGEVAAVVMRHFDRLSPSMRDGLDVLCQWAQESLRIVSVSQEIDFGGAAGKRIGDVLSAVAEMGRATRREGTRVGLQAARDRGTFGGRPPGSTKGKPDRAKKLADKGLSIPKIVATMGISRSTVYRYLQK